MKSLRDYIAESQLAHSQPVTGDTFAINIKEDTLLETWVCDEVEDGIVLYADDTVISILEEHGYLRDVPVMENASYEVFSADSDGEDVDIVDRGEYDREGEMAKDQLSTMIRAARRLTGMLDDDENMPEWVQAKIVKAADYVDTAADYMQSQKQDGMTEAEMDEAKYQGREVPLGKPMRGDVKKFKVYVRNPKTGNIKKVNFGHGGKSARRLGQKTMRIRKSDPARRKSFRARHNCDNPGPRTSARYWSCRAW